MLSQPRERNAGEGDSSSRTIRSIRERAAGRLCHLAASFSAPFIARDTTAAGTLALAATAPAPATRPMAAATDADRDGTMLVFSYGSNSTAQLRARVGCPALTSLPARAPGWLRVFCLRSAGWGGGGVASLAPADQDKVVFGAVVALTPVQLEMLDAYEGGYRKESVRLPLPPQLAHSGKGSSGHVWAPHAAI